MWAIVWCVGSLVVCATGFFMGRLYQYQKPKFVSTTQPMHQDYTQVNASIYRVDSKRPIGFVMPERIR
jgi:hypothetical protein